MRIIILILFLLTGQHSFSQNNDQWKQSKDEQGIKISVRKTDESQFKQVLGVMHIKTTLGSLVKLVKDSENHKLWIYANKTAYQLKEINDFEWVYYNESQAPWPASNRDIITQAKIKQNPATLAVRIDSEGIPDYLPKKDDIVRIPRLKTSWDFIPVKNGLVEIRFELAIDLGGELPAWIVNLAIDKGPFNTMMNMKSLVTTSPAYKNIILPYIKEKASN